MEKTTNNSEIAGISLPKRLLYQFLRVVYKLLYHQCAWSYDVIASIVSLGAWQKWIQSVIPYLDGPRILEIGFGPGHLQAALHRKKLSIFGLDESPQMVGLARRRLIRHGLQPALVRGEAQCLPFADESIHQVLMTFPSEFILQSATISEIRRILVNEGTALILPLAWITGRKPWERLIAWTTRTIGEAPDWDPRILEPLKNVGFDVSWEMIEYTTSKIILVHMIKS